MNAQAAQFTALSAAADYMGNGAIFVPEFQSEITDLVKRSGVLGQRINYVPAVGSPSRWIDQLAISDGQFTDPRNIAPTATSPTRVEKSLVIKSITNRIDYSIFDLETYGMQGNVFGQLKAKDLNDMLNGMIRLRDKALWTGTDTVNGAQVGAGTTNQYVGLLNQITNTAVIASGSSIIDGIRTQVAKLVADPNFDFRPSAIYCNPLLLDFLEQEAKNSVNTMRFVATDFTEVKVGLSVMGIYTAAGLLPLVPESFLPVDPTITGIAAAPTGQHNYSYAIVQEDLIDFQYITDPNPRVFRLGTTSNLNESFVGIQFGAPVVKMADKAHVLGVVQR
jgi:hypothetical protein